MRNFDGIADAANACRRIFIQREAEFPDHVRARLEAATEQGTSPVDLCAVFVKTVYANPDAVPADALPIAAGAADLFYMDGYHSRLDGRALGIRQALRRESGEQGEWPAAEDDPAIDREFAPPPKEEEAPPPAPPPSPSPASAEAHQG